MIIFSVADITCLLVVSTLTCYSRACKSKVWHYYIAIYFIFHIRRLSITYSALAMQSSVLHCLFIISTTCPIYLFENWVSSFYFDVLIFNPFNMLMQLKLQFNVISKDIRIIAQVYSIAAGILE